MRQSHFIIALGIVLALLGGVGLTVDNVAYEDEKVVFDAGSLEATAAVEKEVAIPPFLAGSVLGIGLALTLVGASKDD